MSLVPNLNEHLLHHILSVVMIVENLGNRGKNEASILLVELLEAARVPLGDAAEKLDVRLHDGVGMAGGGRVHKNVLSLEGS